MKVNKKIFVSLATLSAAVFVSSSVSVNAAIVGLVAKDVQGKYYEYDYKALNTSYLNFQRNKPGVALYNDYLAKPEVVSFKDDVKGYVDYKNVSQAFTKSQRQGASFDADNYTATTAINYVGIDIVKKASVAAGSDTVVFADEIVTPTQTTAVTVSTQAAIIPQFKAITIATAPTGVAATKFALVNADGTVDSTTTGEIGKTVDNDGALITVLPTNVTTVNIALLNDAGTKVGTINGVNVAASIDVPTSESKVVTQ